MVSSPYFFKNLLWQILLLNAIPLQVYQSAWGGKFLFLILWVNNNSELMVYYPFFSYKTYPDKYSLPPTPHPIAGGGEASQQPLGGLGRVLAAFTTHRTPTCVVCRVCAQNTKTNENATKPCFLGIILFIFILRFLHSGMFSRHGSSSSFQFVPDHAGDFFSPKLYEDCQPVHNPTSPVLSRPREAPPSFWREEWGYQPSQQPTFSFFFPKAPASCFVARIRA